VNVLKERDLLKLLLFQVEVSHPFSVP